MNNNLPHGTSVMDKHINPPEYYGIDFEDTQCSTWFERDRAYVALETKSNTEFKSDGETILEFWDGAVYELVEDGFLNPDNWHRSIYDYAEHLDII